MGGHHLRHAIILVELAHGQVLDKARAIDAAQNLIALLVRAEGRQAAFYERSPEDVESVEDHAIWLDLDTAVEFDRFAHDQPIEDGDGDQGENLDPERMDRRFMKQCPPLVSSEQRPGDHPPDLMPQAFVDVLVDDKDAAFRCQEAAIVEIGIESESRPLLRVRIASGPSPFDLC